MSNRILVNDYFIEIIADSKDDGLLRLLSCVDNIEKSRKRDTYYCSLRKLPEVLKILRGYDITTPNMPPSIHAKLEKELVRRERTALLKECGPDMTSEWLWPQQCLGIELAQVNDRYGFFYDTRTGKTLMSLQIMYAALKAGTSKRCLVVCPSAIIQSWKSDAAAHFPELKIEAYYSSDVNKYNALHNPAHVILWSMELVVRNIEILKKVGFGICFVDESSKLKSHRSKITGALSELSLCIPRWYLLSATPAPNNESEYYSQLQTIDPYAFPSARSRFVSKYFINYSRNVNYEKLQLHPAMRDIFMKIVEDYSIYVDQSVMPTSGKEWIPYKFAMPAELMKVYDDMRTDMSAEIENITMTVDMAAAMRAKLNQIASGFIMDTDARNKNKMLKKLGEEPSDIEVYRLHTYRLNELQRLLDQLDDEKVIIWANYTEEFRMLDELLGVKARQIRGGCDVADKEQYINEFRHTSLQYLVCHPLSVGMGINLTAAHIAIYYSLNDSWEALKQSSERIVGHINIQPKKCIYYIMQAEGTVNELVYNNVTNKRDVSIGFLEHLQAVGLRDQ